jgi:hypothetical protein
LKAGGCVHVAGDGHVARDLAGDPRVVAGAVVGDLEVGDRRRRALDLAIVEVRVSQLGEGVVADGEHAVAEVLAAGDGEVPGEIEVGAFDPGPLQVGEDRLHVASPALDRGLLGDQAVAVDPERVGRFDRRAARVLQVAEGDDVAVPLDEVLRGPDDQRDVLGVARRAFGRVRVELRPDRPALVGGRVDDDHGLVRVGIAGDVTLGDEAAVREGRRPIEARDLDDDRRAGAEAVVAVVLRRLHREAGDVPRHRQRVEVDPAPRGAGRVRAGEAVVGEGVETLGAVEEVAR